MGANRRLEENAFDCVRLGSIGHNLRSLWLDRFTSATNWLWSVLYFSIGQDAVSVNGVVIVFESRIVSQTKYLKKIDYWKLSKNISNPIKCVGGSNGSLALLSRDGIKLSQLNTGDSSFIWSCQVRQIAGKQEVLSGDHHGRVKCQSINFNRIHGLHKSTYATRDNLTDVLVRQLDVWARKMFFFLLSFKTNSTKILINNFFDTQKTYKCSIKTRQIFRSLQ